MTHQVPFTEADFPDPKDPYAVSKLEAERGLHEIGARAGMETIVLRPPLVYGPGVGGNFLRLLNLIDRSVPLPLGSVDNRRSFIYLGNLVSAIWGCIGAGSLCASRTYLVSDADDVSTPALIGLLADALERRASLFPVPVRLLRALGRVPRVAAMVSRLVDSLVVDSSRIQSELGWQPPFRLADGILRTARWYRAPLVAECAEAHGPKGSQ